MNHHQQALTEQQELKEELFLAVQFQEKKRKIHKEDHTNDQSRFQFQDSIGEVKKIERKLWKFQ